MKRFYIIFIAILFLIFPILTARAQEKEKGDYKTQLKDQVIGEGLNKSAKSAGLETEGGNFNSQTELAGLIGRIIKLALTFLGTIFFLLTLYGGFLWMTARGNADQAEKAKNMIVSATIGLAVVLSAYAITNFVVNKIGDKTIENPTFVDEDDLEYYDPEIIPELID